MTEQEIYEKGIADWLAGHLDTNDYSCVVQGLMAVAKSRGIVARDKHGHDYADIYHYPLASYKSKDGFKELAKVVEIVFAEFKIPEFDERSYSLWDASHRVEGALAALADPDVVECSAEVIFEEQVRAKFKGIRKNSKRWKSLWQDKRDVACGLARENFAADARKAAVRYHEIVDDYAEAINGYNGHVSKLERTGRAAELCLALCPENTSAKEMMVSCAEKMVEFKAKVELARAKVSLPEKEPA